MNDEKIFHRIDLAGTAPAGLCHKCAEQGLEHAATGVVFCRCRHTEVSAYRNARGEWKTIEGMSAAQFKRAILHGVFVGEQTFVDQQTGGLTEQ